jgi:hypothetical protein
MATRRGGARERERVTRSSSSPSCNPPEGVHDGGEAAEKLSSGGDTTRVRRRRCGVADELGFGRRRQNSVQAALNRGGVPRQAGPWARDGGARTPSRSLPRARLRLSRAGMAGTRRRMTGGPHPSVADSGRARGRRLAGCAG